MNKYNDVSKIESAENLERDILKARLSSEKESMFKFAEFLIEFKNEKMYKLLGYSKFTDWTREWDFPYQTINHWINIFRTYHLNRTMTVEALKNVEIRLLKCLLPLAHSDKISTSDLWDLISGASKMEFDEFLGLLPSIKNDYGGQQPLEVNYEILSKAEYQKFEREWEKRRKKND